MAILWEEPRLHEVESRQIPLALRRQARVPESFLDRAITAAILLMFMTGAAIIIGLGLCARIL